MDKPEPIKALPNLVLLQIFDMLPLKKLLTMNQVCKVWKSMRVKALGMRNELTLLVGTDTMDRIDGSVFNVPLMDEVVRDDGTPFCKVSKPLLGQMD